jgi:hypothetical protein
MRKLTLHIFVFIMLIMAPRAFAQSDSNADFNPFPQMEQDMNSADSDTTAQPEQQNDEWPPANSDAQRNNE